MDTSLPQLSTGSGEPAAPDRFRVDASVVFQLGESLISDVVQALVELVKNSYDADATYVRIVVDTQAQPPSEYAGLDSSTQPRPGYILIEDDGSGMSREVIREGWLTIARSQKRSLKQEGKVTKRLRTPLGDKGLGRLGVQRLGNAVRIVTTSRSEPDGPLVEHVVAFRWSDFLAVEKVEHVRVDVDRRDPPVRRQTGTAILITELSDGSTWNAASAQRRLQDELSQMISPYAEISQFRAVVSVNGVRLDLAEITRGVRDTARVQYLVSFDGVRLQVDGRAKLSFFRPPGGNDLAQYRSLLEGDSGQRFLAFLQSREQESSTPRYHIAASAHGAWFITFSMSRAADDIPHMAQSEGRPANPGPFTAEIDAFDFGAEAMREQHVFSRAADYKTYIQGLSGIRVYRDGFGIRVDRDWLGLAKASTSGSSYYGLRLANTVGYVALSAKENAQLEEKTDREGFKLTSHYINFHRLMELVRDFTAEIQDFLRREYLRFKSEHQAEIAQVARDATADELVERIRTGVESASHRRELVGEVSRALAAAAEPTPTLENLAVDVPPLARRALDDLASHWSRVARISASAQSALSEIDQLLQAVSALGPSSSLLASRVAGFRDQIEEVYGLASLGLTAEALAHEISNIAFRLKGRTQRVATYLRKKQERDIELLGFVEEVSAIVTALRKQLSHLEPSLRYARDKRDRIELLPFAEGLRDFYKDRLSGKRIRLDVSVGSGGGFTVRMNHGRLTQVLDNLILNSEYWLVADLEAGHIADAAVHIQVDSPFVRVSDSGRGVIPELEATLFEPFVTGKGQGHGRGLGLFIVAQLLDTEDCTIALAPLRNRFGRRYLFELDLRGALDG